MNRILRQRISQVLSGLLILVVMLGMAACEYSGDGVVKVEFGDSSLFNQESPDDSVFTDTLRLATFDTLWQRVFDNYAYIEGREDDWQLAYDDYVEQVLTSLNVRDFRGLLMSMMGELQDENFGLADSTGDAFSAYDGEREVNWRIGAWETTVDVIDYESVDGWGWARADTVGYLYLKNLTPETFLAEDFDAVMDSLAGMKAILCDIRSCGTPVTSMTEDVVDMAGTYLLGETVISRFITEPLPVLTSYTNEDTELDTITVEPRGDWQFTGPVIILMGEGTLNEGELFARAMSERENVHLIGDPTPGQVGVTRFYPLSSVSDYAIPVVGFTNLLGAQLQHLSLAPEFIIDWAPDSFNNRDNVLLDAFVWTDDFLSGE